MRAWAPAWATRWWPLRYPIDAMPIRAVSFDLFDTLVDLDLSGVPLQETLGALHAAVAPHTELDLAGFAAAARAADRELREERHAEGLEIPTEERFAMVLDRIGVRAPGLVETLTGVHMGVLRDRVSVPPHHADLLRRLRERGPVGLCSNFTHSPTARRILDESQLTAHLDPIVISVDVGLRKPRPEIFESLLRGLGCPPEATLHVGDNLRADVAGAAALGIRTVWLTRRVPDPDASLAGYRGPAPDHVIADLEEIPQLLEEEA
jgi:HAD superfamily hydrolase (TIGR01509 family)